MSFTIQKITKTKIIKNKPTTITEVITVPTENSPPAPALTNNFDALNTWKNISDLPVGTKIAISSGVGLVLFCLLCASCRLLFCRKKNKRTLGREVREQLGYPLTPPVPNSPQTILRQRFQKNKERLQNN